MNDIAKSEQEIRASRDPRTDTVPLGATVQRLDEDLTHVGKPFEAILKNVSRSGICVATAGESVSDYVEIVTVLPSGEILEAIVEVRHYSLATKKLGGRFLKDHPPVVY